MIGHFRGQYSFLSNFYPVVVVLDDERYASVEHAYQAAKTIDPELRKQFRIEGLQPSKCKKMGRNLHLRDDWKDVRVHIMFDLVRQKFDRQDLRELLQATGNKELVEGNSWGDTFWGVCAGVGENKLGKILMRVRDINRLRGS